MPDITNDCNGHVIEHPSVFAQRVGVEKGLRGMFMTTVSGIYNGGVGPTSYPMGDTSHAVTNDQCVGPVGANHLDCVTEALSLIQ